MENLIAELASEIPKAESGVAFTGAGISTPSGIPDFRSEGGIWDEHDTETFHIRTFRQRPATFWEAMHAVHEQAFGGNPEPNAAHQALADLERRGHLDAIVTQNADKLHQDAGAGEVIELHGNLEEAVCQSCSHRVTMDDAVASAKEGELPPTCEECEGVFKPDGVLFGEEVPEYPLFRSHSLAEKADVFIVAGSSLTVEPAAGLPQTAAKRGATLAIVNLDKTPHDDIADYVFRENVTAVLPRLADAVA